MRISAPLITVLVLAAGLVAVLYSLPKVVVNNKKEAKTANKIPAKTAQEEPQKSESSHEQVANSKLDDEAEMAEKLAKEKPSEANFMKAGDAYYNAFNFAINEKKQSELGEKTREWYQKALDKNPNLLGIKANMAMTYVATTNPMQGIMMLREVLATDPTNELALFNMGLLSMKSNQFQKAVDKFAQIVKMNPDNTKAQFYLAVSLAQTGKNKEALDVLSVVKNKEKDPNIQAAILELEKELK